MIDQKKDIWRCVCVCLTKVPVNEEEAEGEGVRRVGGPNGETVNGFNRLTMMATGSILKQTQREKSSPRLREKAQRKKACAFRFDCNML